MLRAILVTETEHLVFRDIIVPFVEHGNKVRRMIVNIEERKQEMIKDLEDIKSDCEKLLEVIPGFIEDLKKVKTEEEAEEFDKTHNINLDLKVIDL